MLCKLKKYDKTSSEFFTAWVSDLVKFPEKGPALKGLNGGIILILGNLIFPYHTKFIETTM
jgi:hypothetical protein